MSGVRRPALDHLARAYGILPAYHDITGVRRVTSDATRVALLDAMGVDASTDRTVADALDRLAAERRDRVTGPVTVLRGDVAEFRVTPPEGCRGRLAWSLDLITEDGDRRRTEGAAIVRQGQRSVRLELPAQLRPGYHRARVHLESAHGTREAETLIIASPETCTPIRDVIGDDRVFGVTANLYSLRSRRNWGVGDFTDLAGLGEWTGAEGGAFLGINPLHTLRNEGAHVSPYSPVSRLFRNPLYIDVTAVPEFSGSLEARSLAQSPDYRDRLAALRAADHVAYETVMAAKRPVLQALHRAFRERSVSRQTARGRAWADYLWRHGGALTDFATFRALADRFGEADWRAWPEAYRDPRSPDVAAFREAEPAAVDYHSFLQFEADRQLGEAASKCAGAGMRMGLYGDLAIGSAISGSDCWAFQDLFVTGASVGAPPDDYAPHGQNWSLPPVDPNRLAADRYRYWILLIRNALAHCGALRIDHVMGLLRQFWIPAGRSGEDGAYVRYPADALMAVLAIESRRRGAVVIGEDLGTVPRGLASLLARWGILSTRVLYFEREPGGEFRPPSAYSRRALVTVNTHDHAPLAGWWAGRDIEARFDAGDMAEEERDRALVRRAADRDSLRRRLAGARILPTGAAIDAAGLCAAVHAFLSRSPAPLLGVALDDLAGETEPVNLPGVTGDRFSSWTRRMRLRIDDLPGDLGVSRALQGVESRVRSIAG